jgi:hypothetical protein
MKASQLYSILLVLVWPGLNTSGQSAYKFKNPTQESLTLPFELAQNLIIIPARINNSLTLKLVLDTGLTNTIITELSYGDTISMNEARLIKVGGLGDGTPIEAYYSQDNTIEIEHPDSPLSAICNSQMDMYVLTSDQFELSRQLGIRVNGLIGSELFECFVIQIDPVRKEVVIHNRESFNFKKNTRSYERIPLTIINGKAYVEMDILQENDSMLTLNLLIDTGASLSCWIAPTADTAIVVPEKTVTAMLGQGLSGTITGLNGRVKKARLGSFEFKKPLISYPDSASISGLTVNKNRHGSLGNEILRRFSVIFDFPGSALYLKPNRWLNAPFSYNRSGMDIEKEDPLVPIYTIFSILPDSPADKAGLKPGDLLESLNYLPSFSLTLDDINSILYGENGKTVLVRVDRKGEKLKAKIHLHPKI